MAISNNLFTQVVAASGLSPIFAEKSIVRVCGRIGLDPERLSAADLKRLVPAVEQVLGTYLDPEQVSAARAALSRLAH